MSNEFKPIPTWAFESFFAEFKGDTSDTLCMNCDGICETSYGFSTTIYLLPGELDFLKAHGLEPDFLLDYVIAPAGKIACWSPARTCVYLQHERCTLHPRYGFKPVECAIYPVIFQNSETDPFAICSVCRFRERFMNHGFTHRAISMMERYILPHLDPAWLALRNELNFSIDEESYLTLRQENPEGIPIQKIKNCAVDPDHLDNH